MTKYLKLITESSYNIDINESENKNTYITGVFASAETKNQNNRIYPKSILEREYNKLMESVNQRTCMGELGHPTDRSEVDLSKSAILVEDMWWEGNDIKGRAKVLNTPYGQIAKSLINDNCRFGISTRGLGSVSESGYVNEDFTWLTLDLVHNASNPASKFINGVLEGVEFPVPETTNVNNVPTEEQIKEAKEEYYKKIWQVIDNIEKNL